MRFTPSKERTHIITSAIEHHAITIPVIISRNRVLRSLLPVYEFDRFELMSSNLQIPKRNSCIGEFANNEIDDSTYSRARRGMYERGILFHTDAVQVIGNLPIDVDSMNIDFIHYRPQILRTKRN